MGGWGKSAKKSIHAGTHKDSQCSPYITDHLIEIYSECCNTENLICLFIPMRTQNPPELCKHTAQCCVEWAAIDCQMSCGSSRSKHPFLEAFGLGNRKIQIKCSLLLEVNIVHCMRPSSSLNSNNRVRLPKPPLFKGSALKTWHINLYNTADWGPGILPPLYLGLKHNRKT